MNNPNPITKKNLQEIINLFQEISDFEDSLSKLKIEVIDCTIIQTTYRTLYGIIEQSFSEEVADLIDWYLYEDVEHNIYDSVTNSVIAHIDSVESLVDYVFEHYI